MNSIRGFATGTVGYAKKIISHVKEVPFEVNDKLAGIIMGTGIGIYVNEKSIRNRNYYIKEYNGDPKDMPKYPLSLRLHSGLLLGTFGAGFGYMLGGVSVVFLGSIYQYVEYLHNVSVEYDKQCEKVYNNKNYKLHDRKPC